MRSSKDIRDSILKYLNSDIDWDQNCFTSEDRENIDSIFIFVVKDLSLPKKDFKKLRSKICYNLCILQKNNQIMRVRQGTYRKIK